MATSKFSKYFRLASGQALTGATVWLVPQANSGTSGNLVCTADSNRPGVYYRMNLADGEYKIYVKAAAGTPTDPTDLYDQHIWHGDERLSVLADTITNTATETTNGLMSWADKTTIDIITNIFPDQLLTGGQSYEANLFGSGPTGESSYELIGRLGRLPIDGSRSHSIEVTTITIGDSGGLIATNKQVLLISGGNVAWSQVSYESVSQYVPASAVVSDQLVLTINRPYSYTGNLKTFAHLVVTSIDL